MKSILITGGAGFIGSHVADEMTAAGWKVTVFDNLSSGRRENLPKSSELVVGDIRSDALPALIEERSFDAISHHAAQMDVRNSVADPVFDAETNILSTIRLLEAARKNPRLHVAFASTGGAIYGEPEGELCDESHPTRPLSPYGCSKLAGEAYLRFYAAQYGMPVTILRYANVYGPRQSPHGEAGVVAIFLNRLLAGNPCFINGDGLQTRDYVFVGDVARAVRLSFESRTAGTFNVGTGIETNVLELYRSLARACGVDREPEMAPAKPGEQKRSVVDASLLSRTLDLPPMTPLDRGIEATALWFRRESVGAVRA